MGVCPGRHALALPWTVAQSSPWTVNDNEPFACGQVEFAREDLKATGRGACVWSWPR